MALPSVVRSSGNGVAAPTQPLGVPWIVWASVAATLSFVLGEVWDISWHISIGRDTFWTPPHLLILLCPVLGGLIAGYFILRTMFGSDDAARASSVGVFSLRAPLGAFVCGWGALAMLTAAPFDQWWHEAYGLELRIISPPHVLLFLGGMSVIFGGVLLTMAELNRASEDLTTRLDAVFVCLVGVLMLGAQADQFECSNRILMHSAIFYRCFAFPLPALLLIVRRVSRRRWACITATMVYTVLSLAQEWLLPLFPAEQKLAPVYRSVPHLVPLGFPLLVIVPAMLMDALWARTDEWGGWRRAAAMGALFLIALLAVQWPFANLLASPLSANWVFGTHYQPYTVPPTSAVASGQFFPYEKSTVEFAQGLAIALTTAVLTSRIGLAVGEWMRTVQR